MKVISCLLAFFFGAFILNAEPPQFQAAEELESWLRSKTKLEVHEYKDVEKSIDYLYKEGRFNAEKCAKLRTMSGDLMFNKFEELMGAKDYAGVSESFEAVSPDSDVKIKMMDALANYKDLEFSARVVHHALGRPNWISSGRGFSYPSAKSRWQLIMKVMGWDTSKEVPSEYRNESLADQDAMKRAIENKWPVLVENNTRMPKRNSRSSDGKRKAPIRVDCTEGKLADSPTRPSISSRWLIVVVLVLSVMTLLTVLLINRVRPVKKG